MKSALINFVLLTGIILLTVTLSFMTPMSTVQQVIEPPFKLQKHIELENKEFLTQEDMDELRQETHNFEQRWDEKATAERKLPKEDFKVVFKRLQFIFIVTITLFFLFVRVRSFWDLLSFVTSLAILTFIFPLILIKTFFYGLILASISTVVKLKKS